MKPRPSNSNLFVTFLGLTVAFLCVACAEQPRPAGEEILTSTLDADATTHSSTFSTSTFSETTTPQDDLSTDLTETTGTIDTSKSNSTSSTTTDTTTQSSETSKTDDSSESLETSETSQTTESSAISDASNTTDISDTVDESTTVDGSDTSDASDSWDPQMDSCDDGLIPCDGKCIDGANNENCGACGKVCEGDSECNEMGECVPK